MKKSLPTMRNVTLGLIVLVHLVAIGLGVLGVMIHSDAQHVIQSPYDSWLQILSISSIAVAGAVAMIVLTGWVQGWL
jgi:hypothetical protein